MAEDFNIQDWYEELSSDIPSRGRMTDEFLKVEIHPVVVVTPREQEETEHRRWTGFSLIELGKEGALAAAEEYLHNLPNPNDVVMGGAYSDRTVWPMGVMIVKYLDTYLDRDTSEWSNRDVPRKEFYVKKNIPAPPGSKEDFIVDPNWFLVSNALHALDEDGEEIAPLDGRWGEPLWVHLRMEEDATYVRSDPETHNQYNTRTYENDEGEEKVTARRVDVLAAAFEKQSGLLAYMEENDWEIAGESSEDSKSLDVSDVTFPKKWAKKGGVKKDLWYETLVPQAIDLIKENVAAFPKKTFDKRLAQYLEELSEEWDGVAVEVLEEIAAVAFNIPF